MDIGEIIDHQHDRAFAAHRHSDDFPKSEQVRKESEIEDALLATLRLVPKLLRVVEAARVIEKNAPLALIFDNDFQNRVAAMRIALAALDAGEGV